MVLDRSGSMVDHDPAGERRLAIARELDRLRPVQPGDQVIPFDVTPRAAVAVGPGGWLPATAAALAGGDRGATDVDAVLTRAESAATRWLLVTDPEGAAGKRIALPEGLVGVLVVGGSPDTALRASARAAGVPLATVGRDAQSARRAVDAVCATSPGPKERAARVAVLISGLGQLAREQRGVTAEVGCGASGAMRVWCAELTRAGWEVWAPSAAPGRRGGALLDATGRLSGNADRLRRWIDAGPGRGGRTVLLVGHSMGGLIAHAALSGGTVHARGLITIGTPHAGSYGADAYLAAIDVARSCRVLCPVLATQLSISAAVVRRRFGPALIDLTRRQRLHTDRLPAPRVPLAVYAGTTSRVPDVPRGVPLVGGDYLTPNDGIVGRGSATGALAGLQPGPMVADGAARHSTTVPPRAAPTQLDSPSVAAWITTVAQQFVSDDPGRAGSHRPTHFAMASRRALRSLAPRRVPRAEAILRAAQPLAPGEPPVPVSTAAVVVATGPIGVLCDEQPITLVEVVGGLWVVDVGAVGCRAVRVQQADLLGPGAALLDEVRPAGLDAGAERIVAWRKRGGGWRVRVSLGQSGRPHLARGGRRVRLRPGDRRGEWNLSTTWMAELSARGARRVTVRVGVPPDPLRTATLWLP